MTLPSSNVAAGSGSSTPGAAHSRVPRRLRWPLLLCGVLVLAAATVVALVANDNGAFTHGPAVDAATAYVADIQHQRYPAAYVLLAPDLRHAEDEPSFAARMQAIDTTDGRITAVSVVSQQQSGGTTVVQLSITRASRGNFTAHIAVTQSGGAWLVTGADDL